jgi:hypothetical protein
MMLDSLPPDHWLFYVIDGAVYALLFLILGPALHLCLRLLARQQADENKGKPFLAVLLILLGSSAVLAQPYAEKMGYFALIPCLLLGAGVLRWICWVTIPRGLVIMIIFGAIVYGAYAGIMMVVDKALPKERVTLVKSIKKSMGLIDQFAGKDSDPIVSDNFLKGVKISNLLTRAKGGLRLEAESFVAAAALLRDPRQLEMLTMEHTEDLRALDLIVDGETLTPEDMVEMGVVDEESTQGMRVLQSVNATSEITPQDVEDVALFIRHVRKDGSQVTANDALLVIYEAKKRAGANPLAALAKLTSHNTADLAVLGPILDGGKLAPEQMAGMGVVSEEAKMGMSFLEGIRGTNNVGERDVGSVMSLLKSTRKDGSEVTTNDALVVIYEAMKRAGRPVTNGLFATSPSNMASNVESDTTEMVNTATKVVIHQRSRNIDPLLALSSAQRAAWNRSQTGLVVTAVMAFSGGNAMAIVNGEMVHTGDVVTVASEGESFRWRLATLNANGVIWEPVVGKTNENASTLVRWE